MQVRLGTSLPLSTYTLLDRQQPLPSLHDIPICAHTDPQIVKMVQNAMDDSTRKQYLADDPPTIVPLAIKQQFEALNDKEKKYAHYISRAAFSGTRVNLRQVSPESEAIYDFIVTLHKGCDGMQLSA